MKIEITHRQNVTNNEVQKFSLKVSLINDFDKGQDMDFVYESVYLLTNLFDL